MVPFELQHSKQVKEGRGALQSLTPWYSHPSSRTSLKLPLKDKLPEPAWCSFWLTVLPPQGSEHNYPTALDQRLPGHSGPQDFLSDLPSQCSPLNFSSAEKWRNIKDSAFRVDSSQSNLDWIVLVCLCKDLILTWDSLKNIWRLVTLFRKRKKHSHTHQDIILTKFQFKTLLAVEEVLLWITENSYLLTTY